MSESRKFPSVLWILPIFLGLLGGIVAALIANLRYGASWWELIVVGTAITIFGVFAYFAIVMALLWP